MFTYKVFNQRLPGTPWVCSPPNREQVFGWLYMRAKVTCHDRVGRGLLIAEHRASNPVQYTLEGQPIYLNGKYPRMAS